MPEAKRNKVVSLTKVKAKPKQHKEMIVEKVHKFMKQYKNVYVLSYENMTTNNFKLLRESLPDSKFLMGKNKVMSIAFGVDEQQSYKPNSYRISELLKGHKVLFFTKKPTKEVQQLLDNFEESEYATGGTMSNSTIILPKGFDSLKTFAHSMDPYLRQLGLPTRLVNSKIELLSDVCLAEEGKPISVEKCKILKLLGMKMSRLKFTILAHYNGEKMIKY